MMKGYIRKRVLDICNHILESKHTVRQAAAVFGISHNTVHRDMTQKLPLINARLANKIRAILDDHKAERHIRGGEATRRQYLRR